MEGGPIMSHHRWSLLYSLAVLITLFTVSCSQPGQDLQSAKPAPTATAETVNKPGTEAAPAEQTEPQRAPRPLEEVKKPAAPVRAAAEPRPARPAPLSAAAAPPPAPASAAPAPA